MISKNILEFLSALNKNNNADWFHANKKYYLDVKHEFEAFTSSLIGKLGEIDSGIKNLTPKDCMFRINRDIRFSNDKRPYKTNFGAYIVRNGKKSGNAGYYVHIEPGESFLGGGMYCPEPKNLKAIRSEIYEESDTFKRIIKHPDFVSHFGEIWGEKLKLAPKGFDKDFADIELLKYKSYVAMKSVSDDFFLSKNALNEILHVFKAMKPFGDFLNHAVIDH